MCAGLVYLSRDLRVIYVITTAKSWCSLKDSEASCHSCCVVQVVWVKVEVKMCITQLRGEKVNSLFDVKFTD